MTASDLFQGVCSVFLRTRISRRSQRARRKGFATRRMHVEALEDRRLLSIGPWDEDVSVPPADAGAAVTPAVSPLATD